MLKESDKSVVQKLDANTIGSEDEVRFGTCHRAFPLFVKMGGRCIWNACMTGNWDVQASNMGPGEKRTDTVHCLEVRALGVSVLGEKEFQASFLCRSPFQF